MDLFRMPPHATNQIPNCCLVAPDGTLMYISSTLIICMKKENDKMDVFGLDGGSRVLAIDCDPDFERTRYVACSYEDKHIYVWDLDKKAAVFGHSGHVEKTQQKDRKDTYDMLDPLPLCFTLDKKIVSASKNRVILYCVASNTFKIHSEITRKHLFTVLKASPYKPNVIAGGTKAGLIVIISLKNMTITHTMRGHDAEIRSLDWMKATQTPVEEEDLFGLYSCHDTDNEFGVIRDRPNDRTFDLETPTTDKVMHEAIENMNEEAFDFTEACQALKQDIIASKDGETCDKETKVFDFTDVVESQKDVKKAHTDSFSDTSEPPSRDDDFKSIENEAVPQTSVNIDDTFMENDLILLLSTAAESVIWIWDAGKGRALDKIQVSSGGNSRNHLKIRSFTAKWLNPYNIITNDHTGALSQWDIEYREEGKVSIHKSKQEFSSRAVIQLAVHRATEHFWGLSLYAQLTYHNNHKSQPILEYTTVNSKTYEFSVNPIDPNLIAIAGYKRISLLNVSKMSYNNCTVNYMNSQLHNQVLTVAWHPEKENALAFGTREGRVGVFDTTKMQNSPVIMKPFFSSDVYSVTWGKFRAKATEERTWTLFCCGKVQNAGCLVYIPQQGSSKSVATEVKHLKNVTAAVASGDYLAIGLYNGIVHLIKLSDETLTPFHTYESGTKLISGFAFSGQKIAVASFNYDVVILDFESVDNIRVQTLKGHTSGVTSVSWSLTQSNLLVSTGNDRTIRVWDTKEEKCEAVGTFEREVFHAIFHPKDNDCVIVGGNNFMVTIFNYKKEKVEYKRGLKSGEKLQGVAMAVVNEVNVAAKAKKEKRKNLELQKRLEKSVETEIKTENETQEVINGINELKLDVQDQKDVENDEASTSSKAKHDKKIQLNYSSLFFLTPRELNRDPIGLLNILLKPEASSKIRHQQLFSQDSDTVRTLLNEEYTHQIASNVQSIGHLTLPMLTMDIKSVILDKISSKTLTEEYIAVAPFISHIFWRNTCLAYAHQCVEQGLILKAISYFLCCNEINDGIAALCQSNYFTEAMAVAKMRKSKEDPIFTEIVEKWTSYLEYCGNFEAAAIVWITFGNNDHGLKVLERRNNPSQELQEVINALKNGASNSCDET